MKLANFFVYSWMILLLLPVGMRAQNYTEIRRNLEEKQQNTRSEIKALKDQIQSYQQRISVTESKFDKLYRQFQNLQSEIELRNELLRKLQDEREHIEEEIAVTTESLSQLQERLDRLIEKYQASLSYLYKHGQSSELGLLFTAESFNQMLVRAKYLEKFDAYRQEQTQEIKEAQRELEQKKEDLEESRAKNERVLAELQEERENLKERKKEQEETIASLRRNKSQLQKKMNDTQQKIEDLNSTLTELIVEEEKVRKAQEERRRQLEEERKRRLAEAKKIEDAEKRAREVEKYSKPIEPEAGEASPENLSKIEKEFANQRGRFPLPVENGVIVEEFGTQVHPVYGTKIKNPGVEISVEPRSVVRSVHEGVVYAVQPIRGYGDVVLINHGKYKTVYGNLSEIMVSKGTYVQSGEMIGLSGEEDSVLGAAIFFMIREGRENLDPAAWLATSREL